MKWSKEQEQQLKELAFEEKSNKEIAEAMNITTKDVWEGRSRFGITVSKVAAMKANGEVVRTKDVIRTEIDKVEKARSEAEKKIVKCDSRLEELMKELKGAK